MTIIDILSKAILLPIIIGFVEGLKSAGMSTKFAPIISILLGGVFGAIVGVITGGSTNIILDTITGLGIGAAATGSYSIVGQLAPTVNVTTNK